jgi:hypothetical protein
MRIAARHPVRILSTMLVVLAVAAGPATAGTSGRSTSGSTTSTQTTRFSVTLTSQQTVLEKLGGGGEITYGWNQLTGTAQSASGDIGVTLLGNVEYTNGVGPFFGFMTLKFASLSTVGTRLTGNATKDSSGVTHFQAKMRIIGGSAALIGAKGTGSFTGTRRDDLGGVVELDVTLKMRGVDIG